MPFFFHTDDKHLWNSQTFRQSVASYVLHPASIRSPSPAYEKGTPAAALNSSLLLLLSDAAVTSSLKFSIRVCFSPSPARALCWCRSLNQSSVVCTQRHIGIPSAKASIKFHKPLQVNVRAARVFPAAVHTLRLPLEPTAMSDVPHNNSHLPRWCIPPRAQSPPGVVITRLASAQIREAHL